MAKKTVKDLKIDDIIYMCSKHETSGSIYEYEVKSLERNRITISHKVLSFTDNQKTCFVLEDSSYMYYLNKIDALKHSKVRLNNYLQETIQRRNSINDDIEKIHLGILETSLQINNEKHLNNG